jgi:hypothetical protein
MPESVTDRPTNSWEPIFLLAKSQKYFYDHIAVMEKADYGEQHANKATSWGTNRKHPNKDNVADYAFAGDNSTTSRMADGSYGRNQRNVWSLGPEPYSEAHFATFPTEIPKRAILAGTSAKGCCPKCYAPWVRVVSEGTGGTKGKSWHDHSADEFTGNAKTGSSKGYVPGTTIGWQHGCKCGESATTPCTVLDPFGGSGTTLQVAAELGRRGIACELNEKYVTDLMIQRIQSELAQGDFIRDAKPAEPKQDAFALR